MWIRRLGSLYSGQDVELRSGEMLLRMIIQRLHMRAPPLIKRFPTDKPSVVQLGFAGVPAPCITRMLYAVRGDWDVYDLNLVKQDAILFGE